LVTLSERQCSPNKLAFGRRVFMLKELVGIQSGILADLHADHEEVADLFERIIGAGKGKRADLFKELKTKLLAHAQAEQKVLYRKLEKSGEEEARNFAFEGIVEHELVENQLDLLSRSRAKDSEQWSARLLVLKELVAHHVREEESKGFKGAREIFDTEGLETLRDEFQREKEKLM
jgi:hypothetical protein